MQHKKKFVKSWELPFPKPDRELPEAEDVGEEDVPGVNKYHQDLFF